MTLRAYEQRTKEFRDLQSSKPKTCLRGAACSKAAGAGVTTKQILEAADWSSEGTFQKFYHRNLDGDDKTKFGTSVLVSHGASNHTC